MTSEPAPNASADRLTGRITAGLLAFVLLLPVMYVASIGPVARAIRAGGPPPMGVLVFYAPLIWLHDHTFLHEPLEWYVDLWTDGV